MFLVHRFFFAPAKKLDSYLVAIFLTMATLGTVVIIFFIVVFFLVQTHFWDAGVSLFSPSVAVLNQKISDDNRILITSAASFMPGWLVIHQIIDGQAGQIVGFTQIQPGKNTNISVKIDRSQLTPVLGVRMYYDNGVKGLFEYPGVDGILKKEGRPVMVFFKILDEQ